MTTVFTREVFWVVQTEPKFTNQSQRLITHSAVLYMEPPSTLVFPIITPT